MNDSKRIQNLHGITLGGAKKIAELLFGERVIKVTLNPKKLEYVIYILGEPDIPPQMQKRLSKTLNQCNIISLSEIPKKDK